MPSTICSCCPCFWAPSEAAPEEGSPPLTPPKDTPLLNSDQRTDQAADLQSAFVPGSHEIERDGGSTSRDVPTESVLSDSSTIFALQNEISQITKGLEEKLERQNSDMFGTPDSVSSAGSTANRIEAIAAEAERRETKRKLESMPGFQ